MQSIALRGTGLAPAPASLTSPAPDSEVTGPSATFAWTPVSGAISYNLWLGTAGVGSSNLWNSGPTTATSLTFSALPINGATVYARLITTFSGTSLHADFTYT